MCGRARVCVWHMVLYVFLCIHARMLVCMYLCRKQGTFSHSDNLHTQAAAAMIPFVVARHYTLRVSPTWGSSGCPSRLKGLEGIAHQSTLSSMKTQHCRRIVVHRFFKKPDPSPPHPDLVGLHTQLVAKSLRNVFF